MLLYEIADNFGSYHILACKDFSLILVGENLPCETILSQYNITTILHEIFHVSLPITLYKEEYIESDYVISETLIMLEILDTKEMDKVEKYKLISNNIETISAFFGVNTA